MLAQVPLFPERASTLADRIDALFLYELGIVCFFAILISLLVIVFAVKYRRRTDHDPTPRITGGIKLEIFWTVIPLILAMSMFIWGARVYFSIARPPDDVTEIYVVGKQWMWKLQHPDGQREINELHVPLGRPVKLVMTSEDVIHDVFIPAFRVKHDVLPGRYTFIWFEPTRIGEYHLFCSQYCGTDHSRMVGTVYVMEPHDFENWLRGQAEGSKALEGRKVFLKYECNSCHSRNDNRAPLLESLFGRDVLLQDGTTVRVNEDYLRESILEPRAKIVLGYQPIMPTFKGQISTEELNALVAFIRGLGPGQTPTRNEESPPPAANPQAAKEKP
jgi:cytochrome c oxidase subunit 2